MRTTSRLVTFRRSFSLGGLEGTLPAGTYRVDTDEELIDGLSFLAYRRITTSIYLPAQSQRSSRTEVVAINPKELEAAEAADAAAGSEPRIVPGVPA